MIFRYILVLFCLTYGAIAHAQSPFFHKLLSENPDQPIATCVANSIENRVLLERYRVPVIREVNQLFFIQASPKWLLDRKSSGEISDFYFSYSPPVFLDDTARVTHKVHWVQEGMAPLPSPYTGKNVLIGLVDNGLDYRHPDFLDSLGRTRVLRYWDHNLTGAGAPSPYNYGVEFDSTDMNNGLIASNIAGSAHGTTVTSMAVGNGRSNGSNRGMAPDANIVMVHTNFNLPNWTLTVADAVEYIFAVADSYGMPAVVNLSVGTYLGSHDGNDPAAQMIEQLLEDQPGRIVVCAAGNSGAWSKYHVHGQATPDTSFTWFLNNTNSALGPNKIYFDFWADAAVASTIQYGFGADHNSNYSLRGESNFKALNFNMGAVPLRDTIYGTGGHILATIESYREIQGNQFHMEVLFNRIDSTNYLYRFSTFGQGEYDLWSGVNIGLNVIVENIPTVLQMPKIVDYQLPDSLQSIVSSWNCSEKVVSVGNVRNRLGHINRNYGQYYPSNYPSVVGQLSPSSSKGPTRLGVIKPDITAGGDVTLGAGPLDFLANPANNGSIDSGGWHMRNGGTSMASPVVAGIAALYLQRCPKGNYASFLNLVHGTAIQDVFTGNNPNNAYGYGKVDGFEIVKNVSTLVSPMITQNGSVLSSNPQPNYQWTKNNVDLIGETNQSLMISPPNATYRVYATSSDGCPAYSNAIFSSLALQDLNVDNFLPFPNPADQTIQIPTEIEVTSLRILSLEGKHHTPDWNGKSLDVSELPNGFYIIQYTLGNQMYQHKVSILH